MEHICGKCKYNVKDKDGNFCCDNSNGDYYGLETEYSESCFDFEESYENKKER